MVFESAKWIWFHAEPKANEYGRFEQSFDYTGGKTELHIAAETDYIAYVNDTLVGFGQYAGYPHKKFYDTLDLSRFCKKGENALRLCVRYEGINSSTHIDDGAGVIFEIIGDKNVLCSSSEATLGGYDEQYLQHDERLITVQLGRTSSMKTPCAPTLSKCKAVNLCREFYPRPVAKCDILPFREATPVKEGIYDLGKEEAGYLSLRFSLPEKGKLTVSYGEHLVDGCVRQKIGARDFSLDFYGEAGENEFTQYFVRVAGRYLQVHAPVGTVVHSIGLLPVLYPLTEKKIRLSGLDRDIYDTSVRTLRLCMHEHYEDCPWREQALYVLDSRNQMLCGYYAFEGHEFQRANILLMKEGKTAEGLLELTYPARNTPAIPFFSIMYPVVISEYLQHTGDESILPEVLPTVRSIMSALDKRFDETGLLPVLPHPYWNFYEWSEGSDGKFAKTNPVVSHDLILNCAYLFASEHCKKLGLKIDEMRLTRLRRAICDTFMDHESGNFRLSDKTELVSQLGNAFALLTGLGSRKTAENIKNDATLVPATLSMKAFIYDALLSADENAAEYILSDIRTNYGYMLQQGATSFWETIKGESDFHNAGSLCHGWSAIPVYYFHKLLKGEKQ